MLASEEVPRTRRGPTSKSIQTIGTTGLTTREPVEMRGDVARGHVIALPMMHEMGMTNETGRTSMDAGTLRRDGERFTDAATRIDGTRPLEGRTELTLTSRTEVETAADGPLSGEGAVLGPAQPMTVVYNTCFWKGRVLKLPLLLQEMYY